MNGTPSSCFPLPPTPFGSTPQTRGLFPSTPAVVAPLPVPLTITPRVGGVIPDGSIGEAWTGGSNLFPGLSTYITQRCPYKYASSQSLLNKIEA